MNGVTMGTAYYSLRRSRASNINQEKPHSANRRFPTRPINSDIRHATDTALRGGCIHCISSWIWARNSPSFLFLMETTGEYYDSQGGFDQQGLDGFDQQGFDGQGQVQDGSPTALIQPEQPPNPDDGKNEMLFKPHPVEKNIFSVLHRNHIVVQTYLS